MIFGGAVRLVAVGDIMLGRGLRSAPANEAIQLLSSELVQELCGDVVTGNLECLIGAAGSPSRVSHSHFQGDPDFSRALLELFDVVTLANNHAGDFGDEAIEETLTWLDEIGVKTVGIGLTANAAMQPATFLIRGCKVAIFGATTVSTLTSSSRFRLAEPSQELYDRANEFSKSGYTCVLHLHAGGGDFHHPSPATRLLFDQCVAAGFTVVFAHHPHVVQGYIADRNHAIFYSLGDFVFDKREHGRDQALSVSIDVNEDGALSDPAVRIVRRNADLSLQFLDGDASDEQMRLLRSLADMIRNGSSDDAYLSWRGNRLAWLTRSLMGDFRAGGLPALIAKLGRINTRKLRELLQSS